MRNIADQVPPDKQHILQRDDQWKKYPLNIARERISIVPVEEMFETTAIPARGDANRK